MKKKKINLIINREDYQKYENYFVLLKNILIGLVVVFFALFITFFLVIKKLNDDEDKLILRKKTLLQILQQKTSDEAKIIYIEKKYHDLNTFLSEDAYSSPYYSLLNTALGESTQSASLKSFNINKDREVNFTIAFTDFTQLRNFFRFIESETFLNNFEAISLKSFSVIGATIDTKENYELSFVGKFVQLKRDFTVK
ncbi:hypothetical protein HZA76_01570 [Candidatus Roizmanbacteria bacterium]|nr:hypothetical protein [Candidatus Roizmanbacteria bacterium]